MRIMGVQKLPLDTFPREVRRAAQRHASGDRGRRADAVAGGRTRAAAGNRPGTSPRKTFAYTNHTLLPEALECWPLRAVPVACCRATSDIIYEINARFLDEVRIRFYGDESRLARLLVDRRARRAVRAHGASGLRRQPHDQRRGASCTRNCSSTTVLKDFYEIVAAEVQQQDQRRDSPRRWMALSNPRLTEPDQRSDRRFLDQESWRKLLKLRAAGGGRCIPCAGAEIKHALTRSTSQLS